MKHYVLLADTKTVMKLYDLVKKAGVKATLAPTPREASHCCGVAILYENKEDRSIIEKVIEENEITIDAFWDSENKDNPNRFKFC